MIIKEALDTAKTRIFKLALFSGIINIMNLSGSIYMLQVYDRVLPSRSFATLIGLSVLLVAIYILQGYFDSLRIRMLARIGAMFDNSLQQPIFDTMTTMRLKGWDTATVTQPVRDLEVVRVFLSSMGPTAFLDLPWIPIFLIVLFLFHPIIGFAALGGTLLIITVTWLIEWRTKKHTMKVNKYSMLRTNIARITASNAEVIHSLGMRKRFANEWLGTNNSYVRELIRIRDIDADMGSAGKMLRYILQSAILGLGAALVITEQATAGIMIASSIIVGRMLAPVEVVLGTWKQFNLMRESVERLTDILSVVSPRITPTVKLQKPQSILSVKDLHIIPPQATKSVINGISFDLIPGTGLALLGPSGSGKTSLSKALVGIWEPVHGTITLDNAHIFQWDSDVLGKYIGYMPQEVSLFDGTIAQNISRFDPDAGTEDILEAANLAGVHELIISFPEGYSKQVGENGSFLSAGQRQRIALARAVYGKPFLVILDEPNANLDSEGENALTKTIMHLRQRKCIVIVISHRASSLSSLDKVMILLNGRTVAFGERDEVLKAISQHKEKSNDDRTVSETDQPSESKKAS